MKKRNIIPKLIVLTLTLLFFLSVPDLLEAQSEKPSFNYEITVPETISDSYHVDFVVENTEDDSLILKIPKWMPGYYQLMKYADDVQNVAVQNMKGTNLAFSKTDDNTWTVHNIKHENIKISYDIKTKRKFVLVSFIDQKHAYIAPANTFMYIEKYLNSPVSIKITIKQDWKDIVTGLDNVSGTDDQFKAENFDILYDCPVLIGNLDKLPSFKVKGIDHHFIAYDAGDFDKETFVESLKKIVEAATDIIGEIPYKEYTFIGTGAGMGGIEHLNNTTISFNGDHLTSQKAIDRVLAFIAHEYFHHYNVKRIRPYELGPFDYDRANRTNLLWVSEGLTVYYEYIILRRAGLIDEATFLKFIAEFIAAYENDPGKAYQSLNESSYYTWEHGPFGQRGEKDQSISYYEKGPIIGLLLDLEIRKATEGKKSLDDVMRRLYYEFYKEKDRGFTDAEFQLICEETAGTSLMHIFKYVYTTEEIDYNKYLNNFGIELGEAAKSEHSNSKTKYEITRMISNSAGQLVMLQKWQLIWK